MGLGGCAARAAILLLKNKNRYRTRHQPGRGKMARPLPLAGTVTESPTERHSNVTKSMRLTKDSKTEQDDETRRTIEEGFIAPFTFHSQMLYNVNLQWTSNSRLQTFVAPELNRYTTKDDQKLAAVTDRRRVMIREKPKNRTIDAIQHYDASQ
jgi:hypothetical protein